MNSRNRLYWLIPPLAILSFVLGGVLAVLIPPKETPPSTETTFETTVETTAAFVPTASLSAEEMLFADYLKTAEKYQDTAQQDLDRDGIPELLIYRYGGLNEVVSIASGAAVSVLCEHHLFLCGNGIIGRYSEGAGGHTAFFYQLKDGQFQTVECIVYHWHEGAWYRSPDFSADDVSLVPITEDERMAILEKYPCAEPIDRPMLQAIYE